MNKIAPLVIDFPKVIKKFDKILERGLCNGVGDRDGQMCIEAAICAALNLPHGDNPSCVEPSVRSFKIELNDSNWPSPLARAKGLRDLGIAQIGSKGVVDGAEFSRRLAEATVRVLIPDLFRLVFPYDKRCLEAALSCEKEGTSADAARYAAADAAARYAARYAADADARYAASYAADADARYAAAAASYAADARYAVAADASYAAADAARYAAADAAADAADAAARYAASYAADAAARYAVAAARYAAAAARYAAAAASYAAVAAARYAAADARYAAAADARYAAAAARYAAAADAATKIPKDKYLLMSASLALQVLKDLKSPGCEWLDK